MKIQILILITAMAVIQAHAALTLSWSVDLANIQDLSNYQTNNIRCRGFTDDSVGILVPHQSGNEYLLILLDKNHQSLFSTNIVSAGYVELDSNFLSNSDAFVIYLDWDQVRIFFKEGDNYAYTDIARPINLDFGVPQRDLYTINGTVLSKYVLGEEAPILAQAISGMNDSNYVVSWKSQSDIQYQIQKSTSLTSSWTSVGVPIIGTGETINWSTPMVSTSEFYRVIIQ